MLTLRKYIKPLSPFKTHWAFSPGSPVEPVNAIVSAVSVTYELTFHPALTEAQRNDAIRFFRESARKQDAQEMRARFVGLIARRSLSAAQIGRAA